MAAIKRKWNKISFVTKNKTEAGRACLLWLLRFYRCPVRKEKILTTANHHSYNGSINELLNLAEKTDFNAEIWKGDFDTLNSNPYPVILLVNESELGNNSYMILCEITKQESELRYIMYHPLKGMVSLSRNGLEELWISKTFLTMELTGQQTAAAKRKETKEWLTESLNGKWPLFFTLTIARIVQFLSIFAIFNIFIAITILQSKDNFFVGNELEFLVTALLLILFTEIIHRKLSAITNYTSYNDAFNNFIDNIFINSIGSEKSTENNVLQNYLGLLEKRSGLFNLLHTFSSDFIILILIGFYLSYLSAATFVCLLILPLVIYYITSKAKDGIVNKEAKILSYKATLIKELHTLTTGNLAIKGAHRESDFILNTRKKKYNYLDQLFNIDKEYNRFILTKGFIFSLASGLIFYLNTLGSVQMQLLPAQLLIHSALTILFCFKMNNLSTSMLNYQAIKNDYLNTKTDKQKAVTIENYSSDYPENFHSIELYTADKDQNHYFKAIKGEINNFNFDIPAIKYNLIAALSQSRINRDIDIQINGGIKRTFTGNEYWAGSLTVIPHNPFIFNDSIAANIAFNDVIHIKERVLSHVFKYGLEDYIKSFPDSLATIIGNSGYSLSIQDKIIIAIARALYQHSKILIIEGALPNSANRSGNTLHDLLSRIQNEVIVIVLDEEQHIESPLSENFFLLNNK